MVTMAASGVIVAADDHVTETAGNEGSHPGSGTGRRCGRWRRQVADRTSSRIRRCTLLDAAAEEKALRDVHPPPAA
jgi:hypothetical protein